MYESITNNIRVCVTPEYIAAQSRPARDHYVWSYTVRVTNLGAAPVQLISRYWNITDARGRVMEVQGEGVVGEQPVLESGEEFEYTSGTPLPTASGIMHGYYVMESALGESFQVDIPAFSLDSPYMQRSVN